MSCGYASAAADRTVRINPPSPGWGALNADKSPPRKMLSLICEPTDDLAKHQQPTHNSNNYSLKQYTQTVHNVYCLESVIQITKCWTVHISSVLQWPTAREDVWKRKCLSIEDWNHLEKESTENTLSEAFHGKLKWSAYVDLVELFVMHRQQVQGQQSPWFLVLPP